MITLTALRATARAVASVITSAIASVIIIHFGLRAASGDPHQALLMFRGTIHECDRLRRANAAHAQTSAFHALFSAALFHLTCLEMEAGNREYVERAGEYFEVAREVAVEGLVSEGEASDVEDLHATLARIQLHLLAVGECPVDDVRIDSAFASVDQAVSDASTSRNNSMSIISDLALLIVAIGERLPAASTVYHRRAIQSLDAMAGRCKEEAVSKSNNDGVYAVHYALGSSLLNVVTSGEDEDVVDNAVDMLERGMRRMRMRMIAWVAVAC